MSPVLALWGPVNKGWVTVIALRISIALSEAPFANQIADSAACR